MSQTKHTITRRFTRLSAAALIAVGGALGLSIAAATPALAHDQLVSYSALDNAIRLSFNNDVLEVGAEILVTDADGADVADGAPEMVGHDVTQGIKEGLADGEYAVDWRVVSSDGHPIQGLLNFTIADGAITALEPVTTDEGAEHEHGDDEDSDHAAAEQDGPGAATVIAVSVGALIVVAGVIAATVVGSRRRKQAIEAAAEQAEKPSED